MKKRWALVLLFSSSSQASWHAEPRFYSGNELDGGVIAYYSLPWFDIGTGVQSGFDILKDKHEVDVEVQLSKMFQLNERWAFSIGFGSLIGEHWLSDYQLRYRVNDFSWLTAGYRYHLEEHYDNQNQFYLGYRLSLRDTADALALSPTVGAFSEFMADSEIYAQGSFNMVKEVPQYGGGLGVNFVSSPWGLEFNMARSGSESYKKVKYDLDWFALSSTYRWEDILTDNLTLKAGMGIASIEMDKQEWALTPNIEIGYQLSQYWDVFSGYRFFFGRDFEKRVSPNALILGVRAYWSRSSPMTTLLDDEYLPPAMKTLRSNSFVLSKQMSQIMKEQNPELNQFFIQPDALNVDWQSLNLTLESGQVFHVPLMNQAGQLIQAFPDGKQTMYFTLIGQDKSTGGIRKIEGTQLIMLNKGEGLNVLFSVKSNILGETLHVQAY